MSPSATGPAPVLAVVAGGALGGLLRWSITEVVPGAGDTVDPVLLAINVLGAFLLGLLPGLLGRLRTGWRPRELAGAFLGPGLLGGFTTLSAVTVLTDALLREGRAGVAAAQLVGTLVAAVAAVALARRLLPPPRERA